MLCPICATTGGSNLFLKFHFSKLVSVFLSVTQYLHCNSINLYFIAYSKLNVKWKYGQHVLKSLMLVILAPPDSAHNAPSYRACIQLLSSLSGYQYTRRAWKKEAFDLFMDHTFFQMDSSCVSQ